MRILGIESSCDETAAAVVEDGVRIRSSVVASQIRVHAEYGGVVPELASREHVDNICYVVSRALAEAGTSFKDLDAIAVTRGPGLMGALLVGLSYAKALAFALERPFVGVNHLEGHIYSVFLDHPEAELPALSLVVSGGHTNLFLLKAIGRCELLAKTRDDAAGEALDKLAKHLGLGYPGGPIIERLARSGDPGTVRFTLPKISDSSIDFSFSGLKTAAIRYADAKGLSAACSKLDPGGDTISEGVLDLAASYQSALIRQLVDRTEKALFNHSVESIQISGGVSCNRALRDEFSAHFAQRRFPVYFPRPSLTTDNAAMIAAAAYHRLRAGQTDHWDLPADPNLRVLEVPSK